MSAHLGCWVSDLVDGQLDAATTERALAHVATCARCADELAAARAAHRALAAARDVAPDPGLTDRLLALSASIPPAADDPLRADGPRAWHDPAPAWGPALTGDLEARHRRVRRRRFVAVGASGVGLLGVALLTLGQAPVVTPDPSRAAALSTLAEAAGQPAAQTLAGGASSGTAVDLSGPDGPTTIALAWLEEHGWAAPSGLPEGYEVTALRVDGAAEGPAVRRVGAADAGSDTGSDTGSERDGVVELDVAGPDGTIVVRQRYGRLAAATGGTALRVPGHDVHVLSSEPWHVVWQAGDTAVDVSADVPDDVLTDLVAAFPGGRYDAGVLPQLSRGWTTVTGVLWRP